MKRFIAAIIAVCYLCLSTGFTLHVHYCMGKRISSSLIDKSSRHKCAHCGMVKQSSKKGCCKDEFKIVKGKSDAAFAKTVGNFMLVWDALTPSTLYASYNDDVAASEQQKKTSDRPHGPPLTSGMRLHVRNCVFLI